MIEEDRRKELAAQMKHVWTELDEGEDQEYDFNKANWMDIEPEKQKKAAIDKDLNPDSIGKEQFPDQFYCEV